MWSQDNAECGAQEEPSSRQGTSKPKQYLEGKRVAGSACNLATGKVTDNCGENQKQDNVIEDEQREVGDGIEGMQNIGGGDRSLSEGLRETNVQKDAGTSHPPSPHQPGRSSLDDIQQWPWAWQAKGTAGASRLTLPLSTSTSLNSVSPVKTGTFQARNSLEQLEIRPEAIPLPERGKKKQIIYSKNEDSGPLVGRDGAWSRKKRKKKTPVPLSAPAVSTDVEIYRRKIDVLAMRLRNFETIATTAVRHQWSPRVVYYDRLKSARDHAPRRYEPWESRISAPLFEEFHGTLRNISADCNQRIVLVEDLTPSLVDLLGATFQIPPHVFEEHLDRSGYKKNTGDVDSSAAWYTRSSTQGYSSVTWYRPVLPLLPVTSRFRSKLIRDRKPRVRCPFDGCHDDGHNIRLNTQSNIWRRQLDLCPEPGVYHKGSDTEYPVGWEERATIWMREYDGCNFSKTGPRRQRAVGTDRQLVILLVDPLPIVSVHGNVAVRDRQLRRAAPTLPNLWIRTEDKRTRSRGSRAQGPSHGDLVQVWATSLPPDLPPPPEPHPCRYIGGYASSLQTSDIA